jgi:DNA-binding SARP family transcriptional activator
MPRLALFVLGPPRLELDGAPVTVDTRKAIALFVYLAVTRQRHTRDTLAALLWPEYDETHARATLRRTLSALHKALAGAWLAIDRDTIGLVEGAELRSDVHAFRNRLAECRTHGHREGEVCAECLPLLTAAVALYHDDFLAGFGLRNSGPFEDWQLEQRERLRRELAGALDRLALGHSARREFEPAIAFARRRLALDPLHEPAHRQLMRALAWAGQRTAALRQYRECVRVLDQELGVAPLEATTHHYEAIRDNRAPPLPELAERRTQSVGADGARPASRDTVLERPPGTQAAPDSAPPSHGALPDHTYAMVGRDTEWRRLLAAYGSIAGDGHVIVLEGEAGIGKTRLAEELVTHARAQGAGVLEARCYEGEMTLAYAPLIAALRAALAGGRAGWPGELPAPWLSEVARLLPEIAVLRPNLPPAPPLDSPGAQARLYEALRLALGAACAGSPTQAPGILFLDDVQWADGASLAFLAYLMRRLQGLRLCLLLTQRTGESADVHDRGARLLEGARADSVTLVGLARLTPAAVDELVHAAALPAGVRKSHLAHRLYEESEGLPFFLTEYLAALAAGTLSADVAAWSVPGGVRDLLRARLSAVDEAGRQILAAAAVIGRSFSFDVLREVSGRSEDEAVAALEALIAQGLVIEKRDEAERGHRVNQVTYDFDHEKLRALVYEDTSLARRRLLHRRAAEALARQTRAGRETAARAGEIAQHYLLGGNEPAAAEYFKIAGERARALYANAEALTHLRMALALGHPDAAALRATIGDLHTLLGEYAEALTSYETAATLAGPAALSGVERKLGMVHARRGEWDAADSHFQAALDAAEVEQDQRSAVPPSRSAEGAPASIPVSSIFAEWSLAAHHSGAEERAAQLAERALALAERAEDYHAVAQAHNLLGILATRRGDLQDARRHLERSLSVAEQLDEPGIRAAALNNLAQAYAAGGEIAHALDLTHQALALCAAQGDRHHEAALHNNLADLLHAAGRSEEAMMHLKQAVSIYAEIGVEEGAVQPAIWKLAEW